MNIEINPGSFAHACVEQNSRIELEMALVNGADESDMCEWGITPAQWVEQIELAIYALAVRDE